MTRLKLPYLRYFIQRLSSVGKASDDNQKKVMAVQLQDLNYQVRDGLS